MTLVNALGWIILCKCSLPSSTSHADVDNSHFSLAPDRFTALPHLSSTPSPKPLFTALWLLFSEPLGHLAFHEAARFLSVEPCGVPLHVTYPTHAILVRLLFEWFGLARCQDSMVWLVLFVLKLKLYAWRRACIHTMHTVRRSFAFNLAVCMNTLWTSHFWRFSAIIASPNRNV